MAGYTIEVCCYNLESALTAQDAGADRIELCADRHQGGTTPSYGMMEVVKKQLTIPVFVMIRPRGGDFLYAPEEYQVMMHDIQMAKELGINGVVMGVLKPDGRINPIVMEELIDLAKPMQVTFHRAFDLTPDPLESLHDLISLGVDRLLTSGQCTSAFDGRQVITSLIKQAEKKIIVMPGAGINESNVLELLSETGAHEFHISATGSRPSQMKYHKQAVLMGTSPSEYSIEIAAPRRIEKFRALIDSLEADK